MTRNHAELLLPLTAGPHRCAHTAAVRVRSSASQNGSDATVYLTSCPVILWLTQKVRKRATQLVFVQLLFVQRGRGVRISRGAAGVAGREGCRAGPGQVAAGLPGGAGLAPASGPAAGTPPHQSAAPTSSVPAPPLSPLPPVGAVGLPCDRAAVAGLRAHMLPPGHTHAGRGCCRTSSAAARRTRTRGSSRRCSSGSSPSTTSPAPASTS